MSSSPKRKTTSSSWTVKQQLPLNIARQFPYIYTFGCCIYWFWCVFYVLILYIRGNGYKSHSHVLLWLCRYTHSINAQCQKKTKEGIKLFFSIEYRRGFFTETTIYIYIFSGGKSAGFCHVLLIIYRETGRRSSLRIVKT